LEYRPEFGFNFDPSHLHWQGIDPVQFLRTFPDRIYHVHIKDAAITLDGRSGILGSHLDFGDARRGWDFRSPGHGGVDFEAIIRALNDIGYAGPLSVEWEDSGMDREYGAQDACQFVERIDFAPSGRKFDDAFHQEG
jgi:sugar phosphate isomerase/epimerase